MTSILGSQKKTNLWVHGEGIYRPKGRDIGLGWCHLMTPCLVVGFFTRLCDVIFWILLALHKGEENRLPALSRETCQLNNHLLNPSSIPGKASFEGGLGQEHTRIHNQENPMVRSFPKLVPKWR